MVKGSNAAEITLTLSLGVRGDIITHDYSLSLRQTFDSMGLTADDIGVETMQKLVELYADRVTARITYDAIFEGRDLWLIATEYRFPYIKPLVQEHSIGTLEQMAVGLLRRDQVYVDLSNRGENYNEQIQISGTAA